MEEPPSPPPRKKMRRVASAAVEQGDEEWTGSPLLLLATVACEVAEEEERERKAAKEGRAVQYPKNTVAVSSPPLAANEQRHVVKITLKRTMASPVVLPPTSTSTAAPEGTASASGPAPHPTTGEAEGAKKEKNTRPYKRPQSTEGEPIRTGWWEKVVRMGGWNPWFLVKKQLSNTDLSAHFSRLPLPLSKDSDPSRGGSEKVVYDLSDAELAAFWSEEGLPVTVLDRWGREYHGAVLKRWKSNEWIVVNGGGAWLGAAESMGLKTGDVLEVFTFRAGPPSKNAGRVVLVLITAEPGLGVAAAAAAAKETAAPGGE